MRNDLKTLAEKSAAAANAASLLKAMAHPCRLRVLCALADNERCVSDLQDCVGFSQSSLSQHLARLRTDGLVSTRREAQTIYYRIHSVEAAAIVRTLAKLFCSSSPKPRRSRHEH